MPLEQETPESFITGIVMENVIFTILSERKLGPRLMGVFAGGRLEEYIPVIQTKNSVLTTPPTFSRVLHPKKSIIFFGKSKLNFWTKNEDFDSVVHIKNVAK